MATKQKANTNSATIANVFAYFTSIHYSRASELDYMRIYKFWLHPDFIFNRVSYAQELKKVYKQLHGLPNAVSGYFGLDKV